MPDGFGRTGTVTLADADELIKWTRTVVGDRVAFEQAISTGIPTRKLRTQFTDFYVVRFPSVNAAEEANTSLAHKIRDDGLGNIRHFWIGQSIIIAGRTQYDNDQNVMSGQVLPSSVRYLTELQDRRPVFGAAADFIDAGFPSDQRVRIHVMQRPASATENYSL